MDTTSYRSYDIRQERARYIASSQAEDIELASKDMKRLTDGIDELWDATDKLIPGQTACGPVWFMNWLNDPSRNRIDLDAIRRPGSAFRVVRRFSVTALACFGALIIATPLIAGGDLDNDGDIDFNDIAILAAKASVHTKKPETTVNQVMFNGEEYEAAFRRTTTANRIELLYLRPVKGAEGLSR